jgi:hypothetical protein
MVFEEDIRDSPCRTGELEDRSDTPNIKAPIIGFVFGNKGLM